MTIMNYLKFVADIKDVPQARKVDRIGEVLEMLSLDDISRRLISHLSLGYRQRVGLAQALIHDPDVLDFGRTNSRTGPKANSGNS